MVSEDATTGAGMRSAARRMASSTTMPSAITEPIRLMALMVPPSHQLVQVAAARDTAATSFRWCSAHTCGGSISGCWELEGPLPVKTARSAAL